ncbi:MAG: metallophosphoesterase [Patescibacteria group bacterium]
MFFVVILGVVFSIHFAVYDFCVRAFATEDKIVQVKIALGLLLLFAGLVGSMILSRLTSNLFTKIVSVSFGVWFGVLLNLFWLILLAWIVIGAARIFGQNLNLRIVAQIVIATAILWSLFGMLNVFHPVVKNIEIELANLPAEWQGKTIVQLSDVHLGGVLGESFLRKIVHEINQLQPEIVVITGDLLDGSADGFESYVHLLDEIQTKQGVYFVTGNHEGYRGIADSLRILHGTKMRILEDEIIDLSGLQLIGIAYPQIGEEKNIRKIIADNTVFDPAKTNILLLHSPTGIDASETKHQNLYWKPNVNFTDAEELGIDLQLSGHTHAGQLFPFTLLTKWIYAGYEYGLHRIGNFQIYISSGTGVWGPTERTGSRSEIVAIKLK